MEKESFEAANGSHALGRRICKNFFSLTTSNLICKFLAFISTAYVARILGTKGFGIIGFSQAVVVYFQVLLNQGMDTYGTRETARCGDKIDRFAGNIVAIRLLLSALAYGLLVIFVAAIPKPMLVKAVLLILGLKLFELSINLKWVFQGIEKMEWIAATRIIQQALYLLIIVLVVHDTGDILNVPTSQVATAFIGASILLAVYKSRIGSLRLDLNLDFWKEIFRESLPMSTSYLLIQLYLSFDILILSFTHGEEAVGLYNAAYKIITLINMFGIYYFLSLFPNVSRLYLTDKEKMRALLSKSLRLSALIAVPITIGGFLLSENILELAFGGPYKEGSAALQVLMWNIVVIWISLHYGNTLIACNRQKRYLAGVFLGGLSNIVLNLIFIPKYGMLAAALTTVFSELVVLVFMYRELQKIISLRFFPAFPKPLTAAAIMGIAVQLMEGWNIFIRVALGVAVYFPLLYFVGGFSRKDMSNIKLLVMGRT